jgi:hypothetical protein
MTCHEVTHMSIRETTAASTSSESAKLSSLIVAFRPAKFSTTRRVTRQHRLDRMAQEGQTGSSDRGCGPWRVGAGVEDEVFQG